MKFRYNSSLNNTIRFLTVKWLQIHITVDQAQVDFTETLLSSLGAVSVTLDDAENQDLLEPLPGETPL